MAKATQESGPHTVNGCRQCEETAGGNGGRRRTVECFDRGIKTTGDGITLCLSAAEDVLRGSLSIAEGTVVIRSISAIARLIEATSRYGIPPALLRGAYDGNR